VKRIPPPRVTRGKTGEPRVIACPHSGCTRVWQPNQTARYELHWRVTHDARGS